MVIAVNAGAVSSENSAGTANSASRAGKIADHLVRIGAIGIAVAIGFAVASLAAGCTTPADPRWSQTASSDPTGASHPAAGPIGAPTTAPPRSPTASVGRDDHDSDATAAPITAAADIAARFATAWSRPALPGDQWWAALAPLCESRFAEQLRTVDPANVPASAVTGPPTPAQPPKPALAVYTVPTNAGTLTITVSAGTGTWLVISNNFTRTVG